MCPGSIWEGPGSFMSSNTMFLNGFLLVNLMKFYNTKFDQVDIETDLGRKQERRNLSLASNLALDLNIVCRIAFRHFFAWSVLIALSLFSMTFLAIFWLGVFVEFVFVVVYCWLVGCWLVGWLADWLVSVCWLVG